MYSRNPVKASSDIKVFPKITLLVSGSKARHSRNKAISKLPVIKEQHIHNSKTFVLWPLYLGLNSRNMVGGKSETRNMCGHTGVSEPQRAFTLSGNERERKGPI